MEHEKELLVAGTDQEFANACADLIGNKGSRDRLSDAAHMYYLENHTPEIIDRRLETLLVGNM